MRIFRSELLKFSKSNSTKAERKMCEILKKNHISFKAKYKIGRYVVDFLIGKMVLEVDGNIHKSQPSKRNTELAKVGYIPIHITTKELYENPDIEEKLLYWIKVNS